MRLPQTDPTVVDFFVHEATSPLYNAVEIIRLHRTENGQEAEDSDQNVVNVFFILYQVF